MGTTTSSSAHTRQAPSQPAPPPQRTSETYTPARSPYAPPSSDEPGPVESEDDIPREDNDTPRE